MDIEEMVLYPTELVNKSVESWAIYEKTRVLYIVPPGHTEIIESWKPTTDIARWLRIVKEKDGRITLTENPQWSNPWKEQYYCIELENIDGSSEESIPCVVPNAGVTTAAAFLHAPLGWPVIYPLNLFDPLIRYSKIIWRKKSPGYLFLGKPNKLPEGVDHNSWPKGNRDAD